MPFGKRPKKPCSCSKAKRKPPKTGNSIRKAILAQARAHLAKKSGNGG